MQLSATVTVVVQLIQLECRADNRLASWAVGKELGAGLAKRSVLLYGHIVHRYSHRSSNGALDLMRLRSLQMLVD